MSGNESLLVSAALLTILYLIVIPALSLVPW
jgi:hypothetical protein